MSADFHILSPSHIAILSAVPATAAVLAWASRRHTVAALRIRIALAALLIGDGLVWHAYRFYIQGVRLPEILPLELCDASFWLAAVALLTLEEHAFDLAYYWGVAGSGMAILTPYLRAPLATFQSFQYFAGHALLIVGVLYLIWSGQARPRVRSWWFAFCVLNIYGAAVAAVDYWAGTNFMYLREKPAASSLFDILGPWPWYIVAADVVALVVFLFMQLPFSRSRNALGTGA